MRINNNMMAMNTHRQLGVANNSGAKSMEKLSSGLRINRAGDDAAGLAISEKMRGQIRGLNQASANSQDGISMIQTAEGALNETHAILQRMRELAVQSSNDTNVGVDRSEIQKEMDQLSSEINRIGNTTEFNTQAVLKGDGATNLAETGMVEGGKLAGGEIQNVQATQTIKPTAAATDGQFAEVTLNGEKITVTFATNDATKEDGEVLESTGNSATINIKQTSPDATSTAQGIKDGLEKAIEQNETLKGNYKVTISGDDVKIEATADGAFAGKNGNIAASAGNITGVSGQVANIGTTEAKKATMTDAIDFTGLNAEGAKALAGKGFTVGGNQIEFYNADEGPYTGDAISVNVSSVTNAVGMVQAIIDQAGPEVDNVVFSDTAAGADGKLQITAKEGGKAGNDIQVKDGGVQEEFKANFQVGANTGQSMTIEIADMRASALGLTGKVGDEGFASENTVTNGTNNNAVEAALDVSTHEAATEAISTINDAIERVSAQRSDLGSFQNRLEHTIKNLDNTAENLQSAEARIRDVDMAKEMMEQTKQNILSQASTAMLANANSQPQSVLQLLG